jgi:HlyD family secretion protein
VQADAAKEVKAALDAYNQAQTLLATMQASPDAALIKQRQYELLVAQANLDSATTGLAAMQATPDPLNIQLKTQQLTIARNNLTVAQQALAAVQAAPDSTAIQLRQIDVDNAQAALDLATSQAQTNAIVAPASGLIAAVNIKAGQQVAAGADAIDIVDPSVFALSASVSELDIPQVRVGQSAAVTVDALSGMTLSGKVGAVATSSTENSGVVSYKVTLLVTQPSGVSLLSGMSAEADITVQQAVHVLEVPNKAIGGTTSNPTVELLVNGAPVETAVKLGLSDDSYTEITAGLKEGDTVVITSAVKSTSSHTSTSNTQTSTGNTSVITSFPGGVATLVPPGGGIVVTGVPFTVQAGTVGANQ